MIREVELTSYLPDFMREYKELMAALEAEDPEFRAAWAETDRILYNRFISTADEYGIGRYEKMLGIFPEAGMGLEDRRAAVLVKWNEGTPYTLRKLRKILEAYPGAGAFVLDASHLADYELRLELLEQDASALRQIKQTLLRMLPANMNYLLSGRYGGTAEAEIGYWARIGLFMEFYPRQNLGRLYLDGTWKLDGGRTLNGFRADDRLDLYPVYAGVSAGFREEISEGSRCGLQVQIEGKVKEVCRAQIKNALQADTAVQESAAVCMPVWASVEMGSVSVTTLNVLDGTWKLNGSRKLNAGRESL